MKKVLYRIYSLFGFTRRERNSSLFVLLLIIAVLTVRFLTRPVSIVPQDVTALYMDDVDSFGEAEMNFPESKPRMSDPNTATEEELVASGFSVRQARTLISYRSKGARFNSSGDLLRVYGVSRDDLDRIGPYLFFEKAGREVITEREKEEEVSQPLAVKEVGNRDRSVDINRCDSSDLVALPGIGPVFAARIVKYRDLLGGFCRADQLLEVYGLSDSTLSIISPLLVFDQDALRKIHINSAGLEELVHHPYLEYRDALAIIRLREVVGSIEKPDVLLVNRVITEGKLRMVMPYLDFSVK